MRRICNRRVLSWTAFALALTGLAWALYAWLPPEARWERPFPAGGDAVFSPDGARVLVTAKSDERDGPPLEFWDARTGETAAALGQWSGGISREATSEDFRWWTGIVNDAGTPHVYVVDLVTGAQRDLALGLHDREEISACPIQFSPDGRFVAVSTSIPKLPEEWFGQGYTLLFDVATGERRGRLTGGRHAQSGFTADSRFFVHDYRQGNEKYLGAWDVTAHKALAPVESFFFANRSPDGARVAISVDTVPGDTAAVLLWDLHMDERQAVGEQARWCAPWFADKGESLVITPRGARGFAEIWDLNPLRKRGDLAVEATGRPQFAHDGRHVLFVATEQGGGKATFTVADRKALTQLWQRRWEGELMPELLFTADGTGLVYVDVRAQQFEIIDVRTGEVRVNFRPFPPIANGWIAWDPIEPLSTPYLLLTAHENDRPDGAVGPSWIDELLQWLPWRGEGTEPAQTLFSVAVVDTRDGQVLFGQCNRTLRPTLDYYGTKLASLSPDGTSLLTVHRDGDRQSIRCYDVPARRPWMWILGIPLALAAVLLVARFASRRIRSASLPRQRGEAASPPPLTRKAR